MDQSVTSSDLGAGGAAGRAVAPTHQPGRANVPARGNRYTPEQRQAIVDAALDGIVQGRTLADIAADHGITTRCLQYWLHDLGDDYARLRQAWLDAMLADAGEELEQAEDQFRLARARELFKRATWYAERRDPARYGPRQDAQPVAVTVVIER